MIETATSNPFGYACTGSSIGVARKVLRKDQCLTLYLWDLFGITLQSLFKQNAKLNSFNKTICIQTCSELATAASILPQMPRAKKLSKHVSEGNTTFGNERATN